jgi:ataxin-3
MEKITNFKRKKVYFEKQSNDRLCGVHCLNSLLQAPFFDPFLLAEIANRLDQMEMELYKEDSDPNTIAKGIGNVDDDGNYNVQVLSEALKTYGAEITSVKQTECDNLLSNPESFSKIEAFIFNSSTHWFAIRKIDDIWFNLNSTNPGPGPQIISDFYLSAFIKGTEELGYTNFLVQNIPELPNLNSEIFSNLQFFQKLVTIEEIVNHKPKKINMGDTDDQALERAIELSKKDIKNYDDILNNFYEYSDTDNLKEYEKNLILDDEMKQVMELSLNEYIHDLEKSLPIEPKLKENSILVRFSYGKIIFERKFAKEDKLIDLKNYMKIKLRTYNDVKVSIKEEDDSRTLTELGLSNEVLLNVEI